MWFYRAFSHVSVTSVYSFTPLLLSDIVPVCCQATIAVLCRVLQYTQNWIAVHHKAITDVWLYFFFNHTIPLFSNGLFLIKWCSTEGWKLSRYIVNRKIRFIRNAITWRKKFKRHIYVFPESFEIPLGCAMALLMHHCYDVCYHASQLTYVTSDC